MNVLFLSKTKHSLGLAYILHESILTIVVSSIKFSKMNVVPLVKSRAVKILENVNLVLASKFENFRELPSNDS